MKKFKEKINFFQKIPVVPEVSQVHFANYGPSISFIKETRPW